MKATIILTAILILKTQAWSAVRNPFELFSDSPKKYQQIKDCMHVTSEEGYYAFKKIPHLVTAATSSLPHNTKRSGMHLAELENPSLSVCGLYIVTDPNKYVEITMEHTDVNCETGGLLGFVDGWELNGQYFPGIDDHHLDLQNRITEFCDEPKSSDEWLPIQQRVVQEQQQRQLQKKNRIFYSSQNSALLQYRIPIRGSFMVKIRFIDNPKPCNILVERLSQFYSLTNYGQRNNCTLSALFPSVISIQSINVGELMNNVNYDCGIDNKLDKIDIGGSSGLDSYNMERASTVCGRTNLSGPEQSIFCGVTSIRLSSSGNYNNHVIIAIRPAEENDISLATLICPL